MKEKFSLRKMQEENKEKNSLEERKARLEIERYLKQTTKDVSKEKIDILNNNHDKFIVYGPAGSGKSMLALSKILYLEDIKATYNIVIYTKALTKFLIGKLKRVKLGNVENKILTGKKFQKTDLKGNIDYIIIDESQDFKKDDLEACIEFTNKGYYLFGDDGQQIYSFQTKEKNVMQYLCDNKKVPQYKLTTTYRFPKKIALFCEEIKEEKEDLAQYCLENGTDENLPKIIEFKDSSDELNYIKKTIEDEGWKNVGILVRKNCRVRTMLNELNRRGLICDYKDENDDELDFSNDNPKIITYHSSKGLEFERVFIPQCDIDSDELDYRKALYVACTRASHTLIVSYVKNNKSPFLDNINKDYYKFESR